ncbi:MAG: FxsA family protein [Acidimicrobiia bacterium]
MFILLAAVVVIPIAEIAVMVKVAEWIGTGQMIALLLSVSIVGLWIVKRQGTGTLRRIRAELDAGRVPGSHLVDGGLLLAAGFMLLVPGFITDMFGILLLVPPVRAIVRGRLGRRFRTRVVPYQIDGRYRAPSHPSDQSSGSDLELEPPSPN